MDEDQREARTSAVPGARRQWVHLVVLASAAALVTLLLVALAVARGVLEPLGLAALTGAVAVLLGTASWTGRSGRRQPDSSATADRTPDA